MRRLLLAATIAFVLQNGGSAIAQSSGANAGNAPDNTMVHAPAVNVDNGINASGATSQQSPAADNNGTPVKLPPPPGAAGADTQGHSSNALTASPKGPGTGGNDATK